MSADDLDPKVADVEVWVGTEPDQLPGPGGGMTLVAPPPADGEAGRRCPGCDYDDRTPPVPVTVTEADLAQARPDPIAVLRAHIDQAPRDMPRLRSAEGEAVLAAWRDLAAAWADIERALTPWLADLRDTLADALLAARHPDKLDDPGPAGAPERALWAKQRPGRTGPPASRLDGRRRH